MNHPIDGGSFHLDSQRLDHLGSLGRAIAIALICYLGLVALLNLWARYCRSDLLQRVTFAVTPRILGVVFAGLLATAGPVAAQTNASTTMVPGAATATQGSHGSPPVMEVLETPRGTSGSIPQMTTTGRDRTSTTSLGSRPSVRDGNEPPRSPDSDVNNPSVAATPPTSQEHGPGTTRSASSVPAPAAPVPSPDVYRVEPGQHFWSIAEAVFSSSGIDHPDRVELTRYWLALIETNRGRLIDPDNPDLIMPGQELVLPPLT